MQNALQEPQTIVLLGGTGAVTDAVGNLQVCGAAVATSVIASGLDTPWDVAFAPDGTAYVGTLGGLVRIADAP